MASLRLNLIDLIQRVGDYLGTGLSPSGANLARVRMCINDGYSQFLAPPVLTHMGERDAHRWSFLQQTGTITLVAGTYVYDLPADFGGLVEDGITYASGEATVNQIQITSEGQIRRMRELNTYSGDPSHAAIRLKAYTTPLGPRYEAVFFPTPGNPKVLSFRYAVEQSKLDSATHTGSAQITGTNGTILTDASADFSDVSAGDLVILSNANGPTEGIYFVQSVATVASPSVSASSSPTTTPPSDSPTPSPAPSVTASPSVSASPPTQITLIGGAGTLGTATYEIIPGTVYALCPVDQGQTLTESILSIAELRMDDNTSIHHSRFMEMLTGCIARDRQLGARNLGENSDPSVAESVRVLQRVVLYNNVAT